MAAKKAKEFNTKKTEELNKFLAEKRAALHAFHFGVSGSKTRNVREGRGLRRDIARILTTLGAQKKAQ